MKACEFNINNCPKVLNVEIFSFGCHCYNNCSCPVATPILDILIQIILLILPGVIVYVIWSLIQKNKSIKRKK